MKLSFPTITYCGINYGHSRWNRHLVSCDVCKKQHEKEKIKLAENWSKLCECGCNLITEYDKSFILGHNSAGKKRTDLQKENYRNSFTKERREKLSKNAVENNCMHNPDVVNKLKTTIINKYGVDNISKTEKFKTEMHNNNPMYDDIVKEKHLKSVRTDTFREKSKTHWEKNNPSFNKEILERRINTYTKNLSEGKYAIKNNWKTGYFIKTNGDKEWYDSSLELAKMEYYENNKMNWTKKHGIRIEYINENGLKTYYVPDFLIIENDKKILEETKGWIQKSVLKKVEVAKDFCRKNNFAYNFYLGTIDNKIEEYCCDYTT